MPVCQKRGNVMPPSCFDRDSSGKYRFSVLDWCAYMFVHQNFDRLGAAQMWRILNRDGEGNLYLRHLAEFLSIEAFRELSQFAVVMPSHKRRSRLPEPSDRLCRKPT
jgi:hypothetical protein